MKLFYGVILGLLVLASACAQQPQAVQPTQAEEQPAAEPQQEEASESMEQADDAMENAASSDVRIVGKEGFDPTEVTINAGDSLTWVNDDKKALTLTIFKKGKWYLNSNVIEPGQSFEQEFKEAGEYDYWTLAYGVKGKITVQ